MRRRNTSFDAFDLFFALTLLLAIAILVVAAIVAAHFIAKYW